METDDEIWPFSFFTSICWYFSPCNQRSFWENTELHFGFKFRMTGTNQNSQRPPWIIDGRSQRQKLFFASRRNPGCTGDQAGTDAVDGPRGWECGRTSAVKSHDALTTFKVPAVPHNAEKAQRDVTNGNIRKCFFLDSTFPEESQA